MSRGYEPFPSDAGGFLIRKPVIALAPGRLAALFGAAPTVRLGKPLSLFGLEFREDARVGAGLRVCVVCEDLLDLTYGGRAPEGTIRLGACRRCNLVYILED